MVRALKVRVGCDTHSGLMTCLKKVQLGVEYLQALQAKTYTIGRTTFVSAVESLQGNYVSHPESYWRPAELTMSRRAIF